MMKAPTKIKLGEPIPMQADKRYIQHVREHAIGDVYDALVELVTNADDSYNRLYRQHKRPKDGGDILVQYEARRGGERCRVVVSDKGEGMDLSEMLHSLQSLGAYSSQAGNRGYMGRGAKDCTALGDLTFEAIKEGRYHRARISHDLNFIPDVNGAPATADQRQRLGLDRGNGTTVTLELIPGVPLPRLQTLAAELPWHYALRDIMSAESASRARLRRLGEKRERAQPLVHRPPRGELVVDETFDVEGYEGAKARLRIWRAPDLLEEVAAGSRFERFGILVKGERAIHECSLLTDEFRRDPLARRYFGRLECPYVDDLLREHEQRRARGEPHPAENPRLVIDPNRRYGLERRHPFVDKLLLIPSERLRALLSKDRAQEGAQQREVANQETQARLNRLGKFLGRFLRQQLDEIEELGQGEAIEHDSFAKQGVLIYPTYLRIGVGQERSLTVYIRRSLLPDAGRPAEIEVDRPDALGVGGVPVRLHPHRVREDQLLGAFNVTGRQPCDCVVITVRCNGLPTAEALVEVVDATLDDRDFDAPLEFERPNYRVRHGSNKTLRLYAKYPDVVADETEVKVITSDPASVAVRGRCFLTPVQGSNYAEGTVNVEGRALGSKATIIAEIHGRRASATVAVIEKDVDSIPVKIELTEEQLGNYRARWADHEGKPNLLLISARHQSIARYLGPPPKRLGQELPHFRVLLAEIAAESVCRKVLTLEARERPWEFRWADLKEDRLIAEDVLARMQKRLRDCVARAHAIMLNDSEIPESVEEREPES